MVSFRFVVPPTDTLSWVGLALVDPNDDRSEKRVHGLVRTRGSLRVEFRKESDSKSRKMGVAA